MPFGGNLSLHPDVCFTASDSTPEVNRHHLGLVLLDSNRPPSGPQAESWPTEPLL